MVLKNTVFAFVLFINLSLFACPEEFHPLLIINCGKHNGVFDEKCFKMIEFSTKRLVQAPEFASVMSLSNQEFLYHHKDQVYPVTFAEHKNYKRHYFKSYILGNYQSEISWLTDKHFQYAIIYAKYSPQSAKTCASCTELEDTLLQAHVNALFSYQEKFNEIRNRIIPMRNVTVELKFSPSADLTEVGRFFELYSLQRQLYQMGGVKLIYSPVNIFSFIYSAIAFKLPPSSNAQQRWSHATAVWDIGGQRRSSYLNFKEKTMYMDIYTTWESDGLGAALDKWLSKKLSKSDIQWSIIHETKPVFVQKERVPKEEKQAGLKPKDRQVNSVKQMINKKEGPKKITSEAIPKATPKTTEKANQKVSQKQDDGKAVKKELAVK